VTAQQPGRPPTITLVAAVARNSTIGADGGLPWHLPADLKRFKALTMGHTMIMGRRTFESIGRALPGRRTIVVTRDPQWQAPDVRVASSVEAAIAMAGDEPREPMMVGQLMELDQLMVVGGGEIYRQTIADADRLEITHVDMDVDGDTTFPEIDPKVWHGMVREEGDGFRFVTYERRDARRSAADPAPIRDAPIRDLEVLLASMRPQLHDGQYTFCTVPSGAVTEGLHPVATVVEHEGTTLVVPVEEALAAGLEGAFACAWITLRVNSSLDAVGLTAAVATALTKDGIACNVIAGYHHDHLFVPSSAASDAMAALAALAHTRS
jgi:dihydrofolate reductase